MPCVGTFKSQRRNGREQEENPCPSSPCPMARFASSLQHQRLRCRADISPGLGAQRWRRASTTACATCRPSSRGCASGADHRTRSRALTFAPLVRAPDGDGRQAALPGRAGHHRPDDRGRLYYDFAYSRPFTPEDLAQIENGCANWRVPTSRSNAAKCRAKRRFRLFESLGETYKCEIIRDLPADAVVSLYRQATSSTSAAGRTCRRPASSRPSS